MSASLSSAPNFVSFNLSKLGYIKPFVPEDITLEDYTFLPYVRTGLAAALVPPADPATRATVPVTVTVQDDKGGSELVTRTVTLRGPGDVIGLEGRQIVRRVPTPNSRNVEENYLAHVEFDRPELPWLFTPYAVSNNQLHPWLVLVVVDAAEASIEPGAAELPSRLRTKVGQLPRLEEAWAWAHAQVSGKKTGGPTIADRLSESHAPTNLSRIVCPRRLDPKSHYIAALVPTYDAGVKAGLGVPGGTLALAWQRPLNNSNAGDVIVLPAYDHWRFSTGQKGDFESLAKKLEGIAAPWKVGRRIIDASNPRGGMQPLAANAPGRLQVLRCALVSPTSPPPSAPPEGVDWVVAKREELRVLLDKPARAPNAQDLPRVGPRIYARWQMGRATVGAVSNLNWFQQLNTSPLHRLVAGLGTRVVQKDQEQLMQAAWVQVGEIQAANALLTRLQFGRYVAESLHRVHLSKLNLGELSQVIRPLQDKVRAGATVHTVYGTVRQSFTPPGAMTGAFRRATRVRGPLARQMSATGVATVRGMVGTEAKGFADFRRQHVEPDGVSGLSPAAIAALPVDLVARKLGVTPALAVQTLTQRLGARRELTVADRVLSPVSSWSVTTGAIDIGRIGAQRVFELVNAALPANATADPARAEALSQLLVGISNAGIPDLSARAEDRLRVIGDQLAPPPAAPRTPLSPATPLTPIATPGPVLRPTAPTIGSTPRRSAATPIAPTAAAIRPVSPFMRAADVQAVAVAAPVLATPLAARLRFETAASRTLTTTIAGTRAVATQTAAGAFSSLVVNTGVPALPLTPARPAPALTKGTLLESITPRTTMTAYAKSRLAVPGWLPGNWFNNGRVDRIMAAPRFDRAMYEALDAYDRDWLVPGLGLINKTDFVTILETNPQFTEAFLVGLSDEMGRELLWRGYPTDQRGTYFWRFWDQDEDELGQQVHAFQPTPLGLHMSKTAGGAVGRVVLVVRGEIVKRYPDAIFLAMRAGGKDAEGKPIFIDPDSDATAEAKILFHAALPPDILLVGFNLTAEEVKNNGWWFIIAEQPTAPRFGLDLGHDASVNKNNLDWADLGALQPAVAPLQPGKFLYPKAKVVNVAVTGGDPAIIRWADTSAVVAGALLQNPVRAAFDGNKLIGPLVP